ncbi:MAG: putative rane protein [Bacteroidetes bacterium]|nr:putative rane protein [Bacteroidota bacterium]
MRKFILHSLFLSFALSVFAQDPVFMNTPASLVYLNPSFAGSNGLMRYQSSYRNHWPGLQGSYVTYQNSFDCYIKPMRGGVSVSYGLDDMANGTLKSNIFGISYAQYLKLGKDLKLIPSLQFTYGRKVLDVNKLQFGDYINSRRGFVYSWMQSPAEISTPKHYFDMSTGLLLNYNNFYFGGSVFHFNQPDVGVMGLSKLPARFQFNSSYNLITNSGIVFNFSAVGVIQNNFYYMQVKTNALLFNHLIIGGGYRSNGYCADLGYRHEYFTIQAGYDASVNSLFDNTSSFELHANLRKKDQRNVAAAFEKW